MRSLLVPLLLVSTELKQEVRKRLAGDRHAEIGPVCEIDRRLATRDSDLLEEHFGLGSVPRPPLPKSPLQRPRLPHVKLLGIARAQHLQDQLRLEHALSHRSATAAPHRSARRLQRDPVASANRGGVSWPTAQGPCPIPERSEDSYRWRPPRRPGSCHPYVSASSAEPAHP